MPDNSKAPKKSWRERLSPFGKTRKAKEESKNAIKPQLRKVPPPPSPLPPAPPVAPPGGVETFSTASSPIPVLNETFNVWGPEKLPGDKMPVVDSGREEELDMVEEDEEEGMEEDGEEEVDEGEEEYEDGNKPVPSTERLQTLPPIKEAEIQYLDKVDLKTIILDKYEEGWKTYDIYTFLRAERLAEAESEDFLTINQVGGFRSIKRVPPVRGRRGVTAEVLTARYAQSPLPPPPAPLAASSPAPQPNPPTPPVAAVTNPLPLPPQPAAIVPTPAVAVAPVPTPAPLPVPVPVQPQPAPLTIPRPRTKLDAFMEMLDRAMNTNNSGLAQIAVDGIYKEMDREENGGGLNEKVFALLTNQLKKSEGGSKMSELRDIVGLVKDIMPEAPAGEPEAVLMGRVVADTVTTSVKEAKDTILRVTGSKDEAAEMGKCPNCDKIIPKDALWCSYCGMAFQQADVTEEPTMTPEEQAEAVKMGEAKKRREAVAQKVMKTSPTQPASAPATDAPPPSPSVTFTPQQRSGVLRNLKRLANFITQKDDPVLKTESLFKLGDDDDRKGSLFLSIVGRERLLKAANRLIVEHPELLDFQHYVDLCDSADGKAWIDASFEEIKNQSRLLGIILKRKDAAELLNEMEQKLGFKIE